MFDYGSPSAKVLPDGLYKWSNEEQEVASSKPEKSNALGTNQIVIVRYSWQKQENVA